LQRSEFHLPAVTRQCTPEINQGTQDQAGDEGELCQVKNDQGRAFREQARQRVLERARRVVPSLAFDPDEDPLPGFRDVDSHAVSPWRIWIRNGFPSACAG
jgi:hypothetical protein